MHTHMHMHGRSSSCSLNAEALCFLSTVREGLDYVLSTALPWSLPQPDGGCARLFARVAWGEIGDTSKC